MKGGKEGWREGRRLVEEKKEKRERRGLRQNENIGDGGGECGEE